MYCKLQECVVPCHSRNLKDLSILQYKPVKSLAQYKSYESYLEKLLWIKEKSEAEKESVQNLISLIGKWDADHMTSSSVIPKAPQRDPDRSHWIN